jgi:hypothetical protein
MMATLHTSANTIFLMQILAAAFGAGAAYALTSLFVRDDLSNALQPYADPYGAGGIDDVGLAPTPPGGIAPGPSWHAIGLLRTAQAVDV